MTAYIRKLSIEEIHVSLKYRRLLDTVIPKNKLEDMTVSPRYKVVLAYGSRYEPWIVAVEPIK